jgi:hypothetical protein
MIPRARHKLHGFFEHWLELEDRDLAKDQQLFPQFDDQVIADLRRSLQLFLDEAVWSDASDYRQLLLAEELWLSPRLLEWYGEPDHKVTSRQESSRQIVTRQLPAEIVQGQSPDGDPMRIRPMRIRPMRIRPMMIRPMMIRPMMIFLAMDCPMTA